jgi:hypothetical protein
LKRVYTARERTIYSDILARQLAILGYPIEVSNFSSSGPGCGICNVRRTSHASAAKHEHGGHGQRTEGIDEIAFLDDRTIAVGQIAKSALGKHKISPERKFTRRNASSQRIIFSA